MRVSKASEERRQEIMDAAMRVFYEKGYENTSISDIALKLKVAQRLVPHVTDAIAKEKKLGRITEVEDAETVASFCVYGQLGILFREDINGIQKVERIRKLVAGLIR